MSHLISGVARLRGRRRFPLPVQLLLLRRLLVPLLMEVTQQDVRLLCDDSLLPRKVLGRHIQRIPVSAIHTNIVMLGEFCSCSCLRTIAYLLQHSLDLQNTCRLIIVLKVYLLLTPVEEL